MQDHVSAVADAQLLIADTEPGIRLVTLNRPKARNALSLSLLGELHRTFAAASADASVAAIILAANGPVFCSGHDLKEMTARRSDDDRGRAFFQQTMSACAAMMQSIVGCRKPVIAAVEGPASAAGCQLVATCDLAVASTAASFTTPGVNIGLFCSTPMVALSRNVSRKRTMEMLLLGEAMEAGAAVEHGLINKAVEPHRVRDEALAFARTIASKSKATIAIGKEAFYRQIELPLADAYDYAAQVMVENMLQADANEGICAFIDKRTPKWTD